MAKSTVAEKKYAKKYYNSHPKEKAKKNLKEIMDEYIRLSLL